MPHFARLYETEEQAREVVEKLKAEDFPEEGIVLVSPGRDTAAVKRIGLDPADAAFYARRVEAGRALVVTDAPFGRGAVATRVMDDGNPVDTEIEVPSATVASSDKAVFSNFLGWKPLTTRRFFLSSGELTRTQGPIFSGSFGIGLLTRGATPLSSMFGMKLLTSPPKESSFGMPLLSSNRTPLSSAVGWKLLSEKRTPLSSMLGWKTLTSKQR